MRHVPIIVPPRCDAPLRSVAMRRRHYDASKTHCARERLKTWMHLAVQSCACLQCQKFLQKMMCQSNALRGADCFARVVRLLSSLVMVKRRMLVDESDGRDVKCSVVITPPLKAVVLSRPRSDLVPTVMCGVAELAKRHLTPLFRCFAPTDSYMQHSHRSTHQTLLQPWKSQYYCPGRWS